MTAESSTTRRSSVPQPSPTVKKLPIEYPEPQPLPSHLPPVPEFEPELLPSVLSVSALEIAKSKQAPIDFVAVTYMVALSSLLARHVAIRPMAENEWTVVPNVWGLIVGRPSAKKTPAMTAALKPLDILEDAAAEAYELALRDFDLRVQLHTHQVGANKTNIQKLLRSADPAQKNEAAMLIEEQQDMEPEQPGCTRYIANDSTVEKLADLLQANPAILVCRDELQGFFASLERNGQESARAFYLEAWTGDKSFKVDRIGRGSTRVPRACVSVLGWQPDARSTTTRQSQRRSHATLSIGRVARPIAHIRAGRYPTRPRNLGPDHGSI